MDVMLVRSPLAFPEAGKKLDRLDAVALDPSAVSSMEEIELAAYLASRSFERKANISRQMRYEFLLWLSGKRDIKSAMEATAPRGHEFILVIFSEKADIGGLEAVRLPFDIRKKGEPLALERISLSRVKA